MTCLFGWIPRRCDDRAGTVAATMKETLAAGSSCRGEIWRVRAGAIGAMDHVQPQAAVTSADGRLHLWAVGEIFSGLEAVDSASDLQDIALRRALLAQLHGSGPEVLARLNGEFQVALWDEVERSLVLACDRFGALPLYWSATAEGLAFAGSVAAVLAAPGVSSDPDEHAIREAVTFGGYRLGDRTNVRGVTMLRGARTLTWAAGAIDVQRYWRWPAPPEPNGRATADLIDAAHALWRNAVRRRVRGATRPGTTLSGGLDSRAVLAETAAQGTSISAVTYGLRRCDDARLARRAAARADVRWKFVPLYEGDWLERRSAFIPATDGLIQLADLLHFEAFELQTSTMDVSLSGYIGDVVCGDTYGDIVDADDLLNRMPYSGVAIAWPLAAAREWAEAELTHIMPGSPRFVIFEHKFPQAIHRIFQAAQRRIRVRRPFIDLDLFDFYATLDADTRVRVYHGMLRSRYPALFARLPYQKTNAPVLTPPMEVQIRRVVRYAGRRVRDAVASAGLVQPAPSRSYHDEERHWHAPAVRDRIVATILRRGSISAAVFGRSALTTFLDGWFARFNGPVQVVGALYVFERYHQLLAAGVREHALGAAAV